MTRILIVEDSAPFRQSLRDLLANRFPLMEVGEAENGKQAFQEIHAAIPDLIFMDIRLPGQSGLELCRRIKSDYPHIILVILTSHDLPEYRQAARGCGANHFLSKTTSSEEVVRLIESIIC
ncbi:MAG: response regulator transcription factor [Deltaproteobacteria bacterium]|nr:response regulator transcription factor [Deltaproteobacteria bacterium]